MSFGLVRRLGGKCRLSKKIVSLFPEHEVYIEPFIGGGSVFFAKERAPTEIINDIDSDIASLYTDLQATSASELATLDFKPDKARYDAYKLDRGTTARDRLERNLYLSHNSYNGKRGVFAKDSGTQSASKGQRYMRRLPKLKERLEGTQIHNTDYRSILTLYDGPGSFAYLDPPYSSQDANWGYADCPSVGDIFDVVAALEGKWMLSYDDTMVIRDTFAQYTITPVQFKSKYRVHSELLIKDY